MLVQIKPRLRRVWRGDRSVQIGLTAERGIQLDGLAPADVAFLERLRSGVDTSQVSRGPARRRELVRLLGEAGVLVTVGQEALPAHPDADVWSVVHAGCGDGRRLLADRGRRQVEIRAGGPAAGLVTALTCALLAAGVGQVGVPGPTPAPPRNDPGAQHQQEPPDRHHPLDRPEPLDPPGRPEPLDPRGRPGGGGDRAAPAHSAPAGGAGDGNPAPPGPPPRQPGSADVVVLIDHAAADASRADDLVSLDVPHLSVVVREHDVVVGPLVRPGTGPCLRCLDLHRGDRDPAWPSVLAQLLGRRPDRRAAVHLTAEPASAVLSAGLAALQVLAALDARAAPATAGATLEVELPDGLVARREWPAHPACGCTWPLQTRDDGPPGRATPDLETQMLARRGRMPS